MAPNGTTSRKTPAATTKPSQDDSVLSGNLFDDLDEAKSPKLKVDVKENLPVIKKPGAWDSDVTHSDKKKDASTRPSLVRRPPSDITKGFPTARPLADKPRTLRCTHCKRPVAEHAMAKHVSRCLDKKQEKQRKKKEAKDARDAAARKERGQGDSDEEEEEKSAVKGGASKKRKAVDEAEEGAPTKKKKKKDEPKAKASKQKAPVDVEKQCGVELPQGGQCARSLTCKSHSMGAKRAVPGRSAPYDKLLMEYQRKNQAKLQKAAFDANAPDPDEDAQPSGPIDEQEETDQVMAGIAAFGGAPLVRNSWVPQRKKYEHIRMKGMLASALGGRGGGGLFSVGGASGGGGTSGQPREPTIDENGIMHARRPSVAPGARSMVPPASRKTSIAAMGA